uniref:(northern house mosquito) hypothetical protein n=1 Tax=Culex pipiens TaxID=7175 RepID=A0A8D8CD57_CULPI
MRINRVGHRLAQGKNHPGNHVSHQGATPRLSRRRNALLQVQRRKARTGQVLVRPTLPQPQSHPLRRLRRKERPHPRGTQQQTPRHRHPPNARRKGVSSHEGNACQKVNLPARILPRNRVQRPANARLCRPRRNHVQLLDRRNQRPARSGHGQQAKGRRLRDAAVDGDQAAPAGHGRGGHLEGSAADSARAGELRLLLRQLR